MVVCRAHGVAHALSERHCQVPFAFFLSFFCCSLPFLQLSSPSPGCVDARTADNDAEYIRLLGEQIATSAQQLPLLRDLAFSAYRGSNRNLIFSPDELRRLARTALLPPAQGSAAAAARLQLHFGAVRCAKVESNAPGAGSLPTGAAAAAAEKDAASNCRWAAGLQEEDVRRRVRVQRAELTLEDIFQPSEEPVARRQLL